MLLAMDIGNTNTTIGVFRGKELVATFRMTTKQQRTSDEFGIDLCSLLVHNKIDKEEIHAVITASVVPDVMYSLNRAISKYLSLTAVNVEYGIETGIKIMTDHPAQVGADRVVDAVAAYEIYGGPVLVIDFGTATTYDVVSEKGEFLTGITAPGIQTSAEALWSKAAKLPRIEIAKPKSILAKDTVTSMQAGLVYGQIGQTEYIVSQIKQELGLDQMKVIATGGLGVLLAHETNCIDYYDANLTLEGMRLIYEKQR